MALMIIIIVNMIALTSMSNATLKILLLIADMDMVLMAAMVSCNGCQGYNSLNGFNSCNDINFSKDSSSCDD